MTKNLKIIFLLYRQKINLPINLLNQLFPSDKELTLSPIQNAGDCYLINAFNVFILAVGNIVFIKHMLFNNIGRSNTMTNVINCSIYIIICI